MADWNETLSFSPPSGPRQPGACGEISASRATPTWIPGGGPASRAGSSSGPRPAAL